MATKSEQFTILHLDDDFLYHEQFSDLLRSGDEGFRCHVHSVATVDEYFLKLAQIKPDAVVLDVHLGKDSSGHDIAARTRQSHPSVVIFMCSELKDLSTVSAAVQAGADDFIFKGSDERELTLRLLGGIRLRRSPTSTRPKSRYVGKTMAAIADRVSRIAQSAVTAVHVTGESGTGKEAVSDLFEAELPRHLPFVRVNCGAIAPTLLESELFGHVRGAFTGATSDKKGLVEAADGGWIFLDEVASLSPSAQVALLRVLENRQVRRLGSSKETPVKVKVLSATNEDVPKLVQQGRFRLDLWQRLCEAMIEIPPLRDRMSEFADITQHFLESMENGPYRLSESAFEMLSTYDWRQGNVRELRNCLRAMTEYSVNQLLTPLSIPARFWDLVVDGPDEVQEEVVKGAVAADDSRLQISWKVGGAVPTFDELASMLLLELMRYHHRRQGQMSMRKFASLAAIPKSTLSSRLRDVAAKGHVTMEELGRYLTTAKRGEDHG